jgi:hypothetical protein
MKIKAIHIILILVVLAALYLFSGKSGYINMASVTTDLPFDGIKTIIGSKLTSNLGCTPGYGVTPENAAYYTVGLTPGGLCGDEQLVKSNIEYGDFKSYPDGSLLDQ